MISSGQHKSNVNAPKICLTDNDNRFDQFACNDDGLLTSRCFSWRNYGRRSIMHFGQVDNAGNSRRHLFVAMHMNFQEALLKKKKILIVHKGMWWFDK